MNLTQLDKQITQAHSSHHIKLDRLTVQRDKILSRKLWLCGKCGKRSQWKRTTYRVQYWYETPYSCTGGDNWWTADSQSGPICPKCGDTFRNRKVWWGTDRKDEAELMWENQGLFADVIKDYKR